MTGSQGALNHLTATVAALQADIRNLTKVLDEEKGLKNLTKAFDEERHAAKQHRDGLQNIIASLTEGIRVLTAQVAKIEPIAESVRTVPAEIEEMKPVVEEFRISRDEAQGRRKLGKVLWGFVIVVGGFTGSAIGVVIGWLLSRSH